jgi:hypothetical protein
VFAGRSKQWMVVTDRQLVIVKQGMMARAGLGTKVGTFPFADITAINLHKGPGIAALEVVRSGQEANPKPDLRVAVQRSNWLPFKASPGSAERIRELRAFVQSGGRSRSARAALSSE